MLGYHWEGNQLAITPEEAAIVRRIFHGYLTGKSRIELAKELNDDGIHSINGCLFQDSSIKAILTNITYTGNLLLQKEYIADPITKKRKKNKGELTQYFVENNHEAIITREEFDAVQAEMRRRKVLGPRGNKSLNLTCFSSIIKCPLCGKSYLLLPAGLRRLRRLLWVEGLAFHRQIPAHHLAVQQQVYRRGKVPDPAPDRGGDQSPVPGCLQYAGFGQRAAAGRVPHHASGAYRHRLPGQ